MARFSAQFFILLLVSTANIQAEVYKSIDKDGNVTYSQTKPVDSDNVETIKPPKAVPAAPEPAADAESSTESASQLTKPDSEDSEQAAQKKQETEAKNAEIKKTNCKNSKSLLSDLNNAGGRIKYIDGEGNTAWASEEQVAERKAKLQANVDKWCN